MPLLEYRTPNEKQHYFDGFCRGFALGVILMILTTWLPWVL